MNKATLLRSGALDCQVCVPREWTDEQVRSFAEREFPCGTENGWFIRRQGDPSLAGCDERVTCSQDMAMVHIMLDA